MECQLKIKRHENVKDFIMYDIGKLHNLYIIIGRVKLDKSKV